jgi:hypothetical protein
MASKKSGTDSTGPRMPASKTIYRDSDTGRIVDKGYAEKHPKTTEKERVRTSRDGVKKK